jgi:cytochrome b
MGVLASYLVALALGGMAFFSFVTAPVAFARLPKEHAGTYIRAMFRIYYPLMGVLTALGALMAWRFWPSLILTVVAGLFFWLYWDLMPRVNRLRDAELAGDAAAGHEFERLHRESVIVNFAQLVALVIVFWGMATA